MALSNLQYESIIRGYERTRDLNRQLLEERRNYVYQLIPSFQELDASVGSIALAHTRSLLEGNNAAVTELHSSLMEISAHKKAFLREAGLPEDYLEPLYTCSECKDTGYTEGSDGLKNKCHCFRKQELALLYEQSNIQDMVSKENFSTLSYEYYQGEDLNRFQNAVRISREFAVNFGRNYDNLFFYGTVGTGKSFLSGCIAAELLKQGYSVIYFSSSGLFDTLARYSFDSKSKETLYNFYKDLYNCDLMIIDDLGTEVTNSFVTSQLFACLNERHLRKKACIISTNLSLEELRDRYSDRVFSRITSNYTICKLTGPDVRMHKKCTAKALNV